MRSSAQTRPRPLPVQDFGAAQETPISVLVVGDVAAWTAGGQTLPRADRIRFAEYAEVTPALLEDVQPEVVLSSVFTPAFDAFDLAILLSTLDYGGRYRALTPILPDPDLVRREIRSSAPGVDFDLLVVDDAPLPR